MSSTSGGGLRGRGRGSSSTAPTSIRGRGSSSRSRVAGGSASRGSTVGRGMFGQPSQQDGFAALRGFSPAQSNGARQAPAQRSAFGTTKTRGTWQERYQTLMQARERERADAIRQGQIADPDKPRSLSEALTPIGTCQEMCAEYERVQRVVQKDVWDEELNPNQSAFATTEKEPDESRMVKKFRRAAAGLEEQLPSDLRPPHVLKKTCDYLFNEVIGHAPSLAHVHHFVWDRTRAIRNDFSIQQVTKPDEMRMAIECYERIARFHILSLHQLALPEKPYSKYDGQQEREQLDRTLLSLMQYYDDSRGRLHHPNEAEFRAYCVIFQLQDPTPDLEDRVQTWPKAIVQDNRIQKAIDLYMAACNVMDAQGPLKPRANHLIARQDWQRFWNLVASKEVSYLMACTAEIYFNLVRRTVLNALFRTFRMNSSMATPDWTIDLLCDLLAFDDGDEVYTYCERFGFSFKEREDGEQYLDLTSVRGRTLPDPGAGMPKQMKSGIVESKRFGRTLPAVINGLTVNQAQHLGLVNEVEHEESMNDAAHDGDFAVNSIADKATDDQIDDDEDSLFIPEESKTSFANPAPPPTMFNEPANGKQSAFSIGSPFASTFGKPSNYASQPSIFAQPPDSRFSQASTASDNSVKSSFNFTQTTTNPFGAPSTPAPQSIFSKPSDKPKINPSDSKPTETPLPQSSTNLRSIFSQPTSGAIPSLATAPQMTMNAPLFAFTPPTGTQATKDSAADVSQTSKPPTLAVESRSPSPELPKSSLTFGEQPAAAPASLPSSHSETKPYSQPPSTSQSTSPTATTKTQLSSPSSSASVAKRSSFSTDTKPKKPSPLSHYISAGEESSAARSESLQTEVEPQQIESRAPLPIPKKTELHEKRSAASILDAVVTRLTDDLCNDPDVGLFQQYIEYAVGKITLDVYTKFSTERDNQTADDWRRFTLERKYGGRWMESFWRRRLAKTGRKRRERRQRRLEQRGSQEFGNDHFDDISLAARSSRDASVSDMKETGIGVSKEALRLPGSSHSPMDSRQTMTANKQPDPSQSRQVPIAYREPRHKRFKSASHVDEKGRVTKPAPNANPHAEILKRSSFLDFSVAKDGASSNKDTTVSNYFRHKALGLDKIDKSTGLRGTKRRSESLQLSSETSPPALRSSFHLARSPDTTVNKSLMQPPLSAPSRAAKTNEEDEALFARLRAARESLKLGMSPPNNDSVDADALRGSASSRSSMDSPSMEKARVDARLRASQGLPRDVGSTSERNVPAYRLRESRFVPREHYGRAIERAKEIRESRSRETSRPVSQIGQRSPGQANEFTQLDHSFSSQRGIHSQESVFQDRGFTNQNEIPLNSNATLDQTSSLAPVKPSILQATTQPVSFSNHTTQLPSENPFLQAPISSPLNGFSSQPTFNVDDDQLLFHESQDHTVHPSQIPKSLAKSFGGMGDLDAEPLQPPSQHIQEPWQQDSYIHSQAISLLSDNEDEARTPFSNHRPIHEHIGGDEATEELLDDASEDNELHGLFMHPYPYPYARDVSQHDVETESQGWHSQVEETDDYISAQVPDGYDEEVSDEESEDIVNGYADDEEDVERGVEGDIDEDETEVDEDEEEEDEDGFEYEEEEGEYVQLPYWQHQAYSDSREETPSKNSALQDVGNTAEEAIELSD